MFNVPSVVEAGLKVLDRVLPNEEARAEAKLKLLELAQTGELAKLTAETELAKAGSENVRTEAASANMLASSWRPIVMLTFTGLIVSRWFGWSSDGLTEAEALKLWGIVELGLGGYVIGRSAEKVVPAVAAAIAKGAAK